ncbi:MAG: ABC transporter permease subunit [Thermomicrobiales bacterium]
MSATLLTLTWRGIRRGLTGLAALCAAIAAFTFVQPLVIASFGGAGAMDAIMSRVPPAFQAFARTRPEFLAMTGLPGYLSLGFTHPIFIVMAGAAVISYTARVLAGEMASGSLQIPLSRDISRTTVYLSCVAGASFICLIVSVVGPVGMLAGLAYADPGPFPAGHLVAVGIDTFALLWAIAGLSLLFSAAASNAGRVVGWSLGLLLISYFIDYFAGVWKPLERVLFLSLFEYFTPTPTLVNGVADPRAVSTLLITGGLAFIAGWAVFHQRDLPG